MMGGDNDCEEGLLPRLGRALLTSIDSAKKQRRTEFFEGLLDEDDDVKYTVSVSYVEIYNEKVYDLLSPVQHLNSNLKVREHPKTGPYAEGVHIEEVTTWDEMKAVLEQGQKTRRVAATNMNVESSRSHAIFTIEFRQISRRNTFPLQVSV